MKSLLAATLLSVSALILWGFTFKRGIRGEENPESPAGSLHAELDAAPARASGANDPRAAFPPTRSSAVPRLSRFSPVEAHSQADPAQPWKRPSRSTIVPDTEEPELSGDQRLPREEREDISYATSHKQRLQPARSPLPLRNIPHAVTPPTSITHDMTDAVPVTTPPSTVSSLSPFPAEDEDFRYRQIHGQHAWMARHIRMHNGIQEDGPDH